MNCSPTVDKWTAIRKWIYNITVTQHVQIITNFDLKYDDHNNNNNNSTNNSNIFVKEIMITGIHIITI